MVLTHTLFLLWNLMAVISSNPLNNKRVRKDTGIDAFTLGFLENMGYFSQSKPSGVGQILATQQSIEMAIKNFQKFAKITVTGKIDTATKEMMLKPRCGMPDMENGENRRRKKRFNLQGSSWEKTDLTWALENSNDDGISNIDVRNIMRRSFAKWEAITNLRFIERNELPEDRTDIRVRFERGSHGDPYAFDGSGGTLAHAFYPHNNKGFSGDVHFDDDERYVVGEGGTANDGSKLYKLLWVAVHEIGHSIGLEHSDLRGAIMFPWYQDFPGDDFDLTEDDILGIQSLYGSRNVPAEPVTKAPTKTPAVSVQGNKCTNSIGAALLWDDQKTYIFQKNIYYILPRESDGMGVEEGPFNVQNLFKEITYVDSMFRRLDDQAIVVFHDDKFSVYRDDSVRLSAPRNIHDGFHGMPTGFRDVDASFLWNYNRKLYIFKGAYYWRLSEKFNSKEFVLDRDYPKKISTYWMGLPDKIDGVFQWNNGQTYFFKDNLYYRWNIKRNRVHYGYPQKITNSFLECSKGSFVSERKQASASVILSSTLYNTFVILIMALVIINLS